MSLRNSHFVYLFTTLPVVLFSGYVFFPGMTSPDSQVQLLQGIGIDDYWNWHPIFMSYLMGVFYDESSSRLYYHIFQLGYVYTASLISGWLIVNSIFQDMNQKQKLVLSILFVYMVLVLPPNFIMINILWKDVVFTYSLLATTSIVLFAVYIKEKAHILFFYSLLLLIYIVTMHFQ